MLTFRVSFSLCPAASYNLPVMAAFSNKGTFNYAFTYIL